MTKINALLNPVLIEKNHKKDLFDCGDDNLNIFLKHYAIQNNKNNVSRTYVTICQTKGIVVGYYTLTYGSISHSEATDKVRHRMPNYPIPVMIIARLAVSNDYKNLGLGKGLLKDAFLRTLQASNIAGLRAVIVHAKNITAKNFYLQYGFEESMLNEYNLMLLIQDIELESI